MFIKLKYIFCVLIIYYGQKPDWIDIHFHFDHYRKNGMHGVIHQCPVQGPTSCVWPNPSQNNGRIVINGGASWNYVVRVKNLHSQEAVISNVFFIQCLNAIGKNSILQKILHEGSQMIWNRNCRFNKYSKTHLVSHRHNEIKDKVKFYVVPGKLFNINSLQLFMEF